MSEREGKVYYPLKKEMIKLVKLHEALDSIADRQRTGTLDLSEAKTLAAENVIKVIGREPSQFASGPLVRLYKLCSNGWIREAACEMPLLYPMLYRPETWVSTTKEKAEQRARKTVRA